MDYIRKTLVEQRKARRIKQNAVAKFINISNVALSRYERGHTDMSMDKIEKYAEYLGLELFFILKK
jgi:transcriptional regulator with XRE-family HTH domain